EDVVRHCLEKAPDDRPKNATELVQHYEQALGRRITIVRRPAPANQTKLPPSPPAAAAPVGAGPTTRLPGGSGGIRHSVEAVMPEAMALVKLKGFVYDLGGEVLESIPGMIKVRVPQPQ